jgi:MFS family permease
MNVGEPCPHLSRALRTPRSSWRQLSGYQWLVLAVAWLGWVFDSMDATIYSMVMTPALRDLLGARATTGNIAWYGGVIFSVFIVGWALGGIIFGMVADRLGRTRTLVITILIYAVFTGLAGLSRNWWELGIYRFLTALGIGGEWAAGATLLSEVWPDSLRVKGAGLLQSAWGAGFFIAAGANAALSAHSWRLMFLVGLLPGLVAMYAPMRLREPEKWREARRVASTSSSTRRIPLAQLFEPELRRDTFVGTTLAFVAVFGLWGATNWTPSLLHEFLGSQALGAAETARLASYAVMSLNGGAIVGYLAFPFFAERWGRRGAFFLMLLGSAFALPAAFLLPSTYSQVLLMLPILGFFSNGIFSGFPVYLPEIFPTRIRATGAGFCFNAGRILAASGPFLTGYLVAQFGSYARAASAIAVIYLLGLATLPFARETKGEALR